uniref:Uncharacterized protein n=1 Tax=Rhodnius prolixus TaxID=13249 RepID=T1I0B9_RHOPR
MSGKDNFNREIGVRQEQDIFVRLIDSVTKQYNFFAYYLFEVRRIGNGYGFSHFRLILRGNM